MELVKERKTLCKHVIAETENNLKKSKGGSKGEQLEGTANEGGNGLKKESELYSEKLENQLIEFQKEKLELKKMEIQLNKLEQECKILGWERDIFLCKLELENMFAAKIRKVLMKSKGENNSKTFEHVGKKNKLKFLKRSSQRKELVILRKELSYLEEKFKIYQQREQESKREFQIYIGGEEELSKFEEGNSKLEEQREILEQKGEKKMKNSQRFQYLADLGVMGKKVKKVNHRNHNSHGQQLLWLLSGSGDAIKLCLPVEYNSSISENEWSGKAKIPAEYFPPSVHLFNAYAVHGSGDNSVHETLYPAPTHLFERSNFHRLEFFRRIDFNKVLPSNPSSKLSPLWKQALKEAHEIPFSC